MKTYSFYAYGCRPGVLRSALRLHTFSSTLLKNLGVFDASHPHIVLMKQGIYLGHFGRSHAIQCLTDPTVQRMDLYLEATEPVHVREILETIETYFEPHRVVMK